MSMSAVFVLDIKGKVIISRNYRGDIEMSLIEKFMPLVLEKEEEGTQTPICVHQDVTFVYIKYNNLYLVSMTKKNANVALLFVFLHTIVQGQPMQMSRMNHPRVPVPPNYGGMRPPPNSSVAPGVNMPMTGSRTCNPTTSVAGPPGTPIMASPQDPASTGSESMYAMMKSVPGGSIPAYMGGGPEPPLPLGAQEAPLVMNDSNPDMDGLPKDNPNDHNPGTPGEGDGQFGNLLPFSQDNDHCESVAILKIKESMQEEARRFENVDETTDHQGEFFMQ
ncbi:single-stranded DNA-binding protein 3-like isoform X1 [Montipora capricornis]|uniref:single-stranded DNA-binding protein 3-like isoform X1 n=1 Tax=Montipora capricornis TaxID=246305 RepID=UPI0035F1E2CA